ncbi:arginase family protein [Gemmata sp. G18]|uniref:Arginase family protein n=1 Tax=Gemmata palustris TaxID=2822762 RepID=A0ABS5BN19_9BACT|nr:arginase family protein [Gemmata palustris]MBP3955061.1 arginase family protein [Gemmata palustris]
MRATVTVFPFDLFGSAGTGAGARLLGDAVHEILDDTDRETRPCRADVLRGTVKVKEFAFDALAEVTNWRKHGRQAARQALKSKEFLLWLGGNHLAALPVLEELGADTLVVQFDAHLDVYAFHDTKTELSHGNFLTHFEAPRPRLVNVGHRDLFLAPEEIGETFEAVYPAWDVAADVARVAAELRVKAKAAKRVWIDIDCDAIDPTALPAVHEPLPFGLAPPAFLALFEAAWEGKVAGVSITEFDPGRDVRDASLNLLGWLVEYVLLKAAARAP